MSSFPPKRWQVRFLKDMATLACDAPDAGEIGMAAFLAVKPAGIEEGNFRFVLAGPDRLKIKFKIADVLNNQLFNGMFTESELSVGDQIQFEKNTVSSEWSDVVELVRSQDYMITNDNDDDVSEAFLANLEQHKLALMEQTNRGDLAGICIRWILGTRGSSTDILLLAQVSLLHALQIFNKLQCMRLTSLVLLFNSLLMHPKHICRHCRAPWDCWTPTLTSRLTPPWG